jgi:hypothetical protein
MRKLMLIMAFVTGFGAIAGAQTKTRTHKTPEQRAEFLTKKLGEKMVLTSAQSARVTEIFKARAIRMDSLKANQANSDKKQDRLAVRGILANTDKQLKEVLNADQQKAYAAIKVENKAKFKAFARNHKHRSPEKKAEMMTKRLDEKLNLSQDQESKVKSILLTQATKVDSLKATLKAGNIKGDRKQNRAAFKGIRQNTDQQLSAVLNADQQKAYTEWKAAKKEKIKSRKEAHTENKVG